MFGGDGGDDLMGGESLEQMLMETAADDLMGGSGGASSARRPCSPRAAPGARAITRAVSC